MRVRKKSVGVSRSITAETIASLRRADIERYRLAYDAETKHRNYAALMEALKCAKVLDTCPEWLADALMSIMLTEIKERAGAVGRWSVQHNQDLIAWIRANAIRHARAHGFTWDEACQFTADYFAPTPVGAGPDAMMKSWQRVVNHGMKPGRYDPNLLSTLLDDSTPVLMLLFDGIFDRDDVLRHAIQPIDLGELWPPNDHADDVREKWVTRVKQAGRFVEHPALPMEWTMKRTRRKPSARKKIAAKLPDGK